MNQFLANLASTKSNLHVSVPIAAALACELGKVWMPAHVEQWNATQKVLLAYGVISAANTGPQPPKP